LVVCGRASWRARNPYEPARTRPWLVWITISLYRRIHSQGTATCSLAGRQNGSLDLRRRASVAVKDRAVRAVRVVPMHASAIYPGIAAWSASAVLVHCCLGWSQHRGHEGLRGIGLVNAWPSAPYAPYGPYALSPEHQNHRPRDQRRWRLSPSRSYPPPITNLPLPGWRSHRGIGGIGWRALAGP
jgi:hypothetical protein